ncbi:hypothetical protein CGL27_18455 [Streptomyces sp. 11-1-2]|nr:hypothetical protein CGL27_18455 [Streptomyces sp. 11-1-2]
MVYQMTDLSVGKRLARLRDIRDLTQEQLADRAGVSVDTIRRLEQGTQRGARIATYQKLAGALDIELARLLGQPTMTQSLAPDGGVIALRAAIQAPSDLPGLDVCGADSDAPGPDDLRPVMEQAQRHYRLGQFTDLVGMLPGLVTDLKAATREAEGGPDHDTVWSMSAAAYIIVADVAAQLGQTDLAYTAVERAMYATARAGDELRHALAVSTLSLVLLRQGRWSDAQQVATRRAAEIEPRLSDRNPEKFAMFGILLLSGAVSAARANRDESDSTKDDALTFLRQAEAAAALSGAVRVRGTAFGPASVGMQATTVQVSLGHPDKALATASGVNLDELPWKISRARHRLDLAFARYQTHDDEGARDVLLTLDEEHPEWLTHQMLAASTVGGLLETERRRDRGLRKLAVRLGVDPAA